MQFCFDDDIPKGQTFEAALESMKQYKFTDLEVSDDQTEDVKVDEMCIYTAKAIRRLTMSEAKSSVPWPRLEAL